MKTFNKFFSDALLICEDVSASALGAMSEEEFRQFLKGIQDSAKRSQYTRMRQAQVRNARSPVNPREFLKQKFGNTKKKFTDALSRVKNTIPEPVRRHGGRAFGHMMTLSNIKSDYDDRRAQGQSKLKSTGGALASGAGWAKGAQVGGQLGAKIPGPKWLTVPAGGLVGGIVGDTAISTAYDAVADATRPTRQAISKGIGYDAVQRRAKLAREIMKRDRTPEQLKRNTVTIFDPLALKTDTKLVPDLDSVRHARSTDASRSGRGRAAQQGTYGTRQGSALVGTGAPMTVDKKANTITTNGRTVKLPSTRLLKTGQVGDLAYKDGKPVYLARADVSDRIAADDIGSKVQRFLGLGRYSQSNLQKQRDRERAQANANNLRYSRAIKGQSTAK